MRVNMNFNLVNNLVALTPREIDVIQHVLIGKSAKEVARELDLSPRTIEQHIANIKRKFGCKTKFELASKLIYPVFHDL